VLTPVPFVITAPGLRVKVHEPGEGKPFSTMLPVGTSQVRLVIVPAVGAVGGALTVNE
jgi:hypothetical protein